MDGDAVDEEWEGTPRVVRCIALGVPHFVLQVLLLQLNSSRDASCNTLHKSTLNSLVFAGGRLGFVYKR